VRPDDVALPKTPKEFESLGVVAVVVKSVPETFTRKPSVADALGIVLMISVEGI
jgi:hypothetical protein